MKNLVALFVTFCFVFALVGIGFAADMKVEGTVEKMEGGYVMVKDAKGKMHKIHTNESTKMTGDIKVGAEVEAMVNKKHHAMSMMVKGDMGMKKDEMKGGEMKGGEMKDK